MEAKVELFNKLIGKTVTNIEVINDTIISNDLKSIEYFTDTKWKDGVLFTTEDNKRYALVHVQDCCENVLIEDIVGSFNDLIGYPLLIAEQVTREATEDERWDISATWSFCKFATVKGYVTISFLGQSNGYYNEEVTLLELAD